nr:nuclear apoptosis-inducing factor 1-like [Rhipicephalus microplus]
MSAKQPKRARQPNFTKEELAILVDGYEANQRAIENRGEGPRGSQAKHRAWEDITATLFAVSGIVRTPAEVRKKWCDVKSATKARAAAVRCSQAKTGGGPEDVPPLNEFETLVANALDPEAISGISGSMDIGAPSAGTCDAIRNVPSSAGLSQEDGDSATGEPQQRSSSTPRRRQQPRSYTSEKLFT